jgi:GMP synthase (glutamine-hydrolysing)
MTVSADSNVLAELQEESILVLDFGGQTAQLIARRVRDQNVFCQMVRHDLSIERIRELNPKGLILSGRAGERL